MINIFSSGGLLAVVVLLLAAPPAPAATPRTRSAVRNALSSYDKRLFAGDHRACPMMDERGRTQFIKSVRDQVSRPIRDCPDAVAAWGRLLRELDFPLPDELKDVARARVTLHGRRATLFETAGRVWFVYVSGHWMVDWVAGVPSHARLS